MAADPRVYKVTGPMCRWVMKAKDKDGNVGFVRKETTFLTSSWELAQILEGKCANTFGRGELHRHVHLIGGDRAKVAAEYPAKMVIAVLKAMRRQLLADGKWNSMGAFDAGPVAEELEPWEQPWMEEWGNRLDVPGVYYWDDVNGGYLPEAEVAEARKLDLDWVDGKKVFTKVRYDESMGRLLTLKWVDNRKSSGLVRSRLVVREVTKAKKVEDRMEAHEVFSAMPPVESLKSLVSHMMTEQVDLEKEELIFAVFDVSRAHFNAVAERELYATLPEEMAQEGFCAKLRRTMYGTQDAARLWGELWANHLEKQDDFSIGKSSRALFCSSSLKGFCHGDDFAVVASEKVVELFHMLLNEVFETKCVGKIWRCACLTASCGRMSRRTGWRSRAIPSMCR